MEYGEIGVKTEFDIKLTEKDLYSFNIYQTYHGVHGIFSILIAALVFVRTGICSIICGSWNFTFDICSSIIEA